MECGFVLRKFQQAKTAIGSVLLFSALKIDSSLFPSLVPSLTLQYVEPGTSVG